MKATISTREVGKQIFESQIREAGLRFVEHSRTRRAHYRVFRNDNGKEPASIDIRLVTSSNQTFCLYMADHEVNLIVYVWKAKQPSESSIYALTYDQAHQIMNDKGYTNTPSWKNGEGYSVTNSGFELKNWLGEFRMTPAKWREKITSASD